VRFDILGPLTVSASGRPVRVGGPRQRTLLAALLVEANQVVSAGRLAMIVWDRLPEDPVNALQTQVSRLRGVLGAAGHDGSERVVSARPGYLLRIDDDELDASLFEALGRQARTALAHGEWEAALTTAERALAQWRGEALEEFRHEEFARASAAHLDEQRLLTVECRLDAGLALGHHRELVALLEELVTAEPLRESLWARLIVALYRSGRQSDALRAYERVRLRLRDDLGISPCPELARLERALLDQDGTLDWVPPRPNPTVAAVLERKAKPSEEVADARPAAPVLPRSSTSFVGRRAEQTAVAEALARSRLVTLTGAGGCGKTRLALAVAEAAAASFPGGAWFVDLAPVGAPAGVGTAVAEGLGVATGQDDDLDRACAHLGAGEALLVLDNCEHLAEAAALAADELLVRCPGMRILATSREELRIGPEVVWRVPALGAEAAQELFLQRARGALTEFAPTGGARTAVAQICDRLDGIPLAIELAAALVGSLPVVEIAERLDDRFRLLDSARRHRPPRHRTLRATFDWSFELLEPPERDLFARLGVFAGDFSLAAAEHVAATGPSGPAGVARGLARLVSTSMVSCVAGPDGAGRYRMLETVRQYARERWRHLDDGLEVERRHACYFAGIAAEAEEHVHGAAAPEWLARVVADLPNMRAALAWTIARDDLETGVRLAGSLRWYFDRLGLMDEGIRWLDTWLRRRSELPPHLRLRAVTAAAYIDFTRGNLAAMAGLASEGVALARRLGDDRQLLLALLPHGTLAAYRCDYAAARARLAEAEDLCVRLGDVWARAWVQTAQGLSARREGDAARARVLLEEALAGFRALGDRHGEVLPLIQLALVAQMEGDPYAALAVAGEAMAAGTEVHDRRYQHTAMCIMGRVQLALGVRGEARDLLVGSLRHFEGAHHRIMVGAALDGLAELAAQSGNHAEAAALLGFTRRWSEGQAVTSGARVAEHTALLDRARAAVGDARVGRELARGGRLSLDEAMATAEAVTAVFARGVDGLPYAV
jgi:predicted ATPase/DNA-binding SARP family transcriptional activator